MMLSGHAARNTQHATRAQPLDRSQVIEKGRACLPAILAATPVMIAYLHGSVAEGSPHSFSDVDIALIYDPDCVLDSYARFQLEAEIADGIEKQCGLHAGVDVRGVDCVPLSMQGAVVTKGVCLYARDEAFRIRYETSVQRRYVDFLPVLRENVGEYFRRAAYKGADEEMAVDPVRVRSLFERMDRYVGHLQEMRKYSGEELAGDPILAGATQHYLRVALECCLDIARPIVARQGLGMPDNYADLFTFLGEQGILPAEFVRTGRRMARMRNRLVHLYDEVDIAELHSILQQHLGDFETFKQHIARYLLDRGI